MLVLGRKWLSSCACSAGNGSRRLPGRCRSKINKRIDTIENRLQKEADKKDGRDLDAIEHDKDKAERAVAKAEKLTKYVQGTLEAVDGGAMPRPPAPVLPKSLFVFASRRWSLWIRALVRGFHKLHVDLQYMQFVKDAGQCTDTSLRRSQASSGARSRTRLSGRRLRKARASCSTSTSARKGTPAI